MAEDDNLSLVLRSVDFGARVFFRSEYCGNWAVDTSGERQLPFHLVCRGEGWLHLGDSEPRKLLAGQLVVFPGDAPHVLASSDRPPAADVINLPPPERVEGDATRLICGYFSLDRRAAEPLLASLPAVLVLDMSDAPTGSGRELVQLWIREAGEARPGSDIAVDRLAELVFIELLRIEVAAGRLGGLVGALSDARLGPALSWVHQNPEAELSVEALAARASMSTPAFARRFREHLGMTPGQYVRHWRMQLAGRLLRETDRSMGAIADFVGYESEVAFRKAFRAWFDESPGQYRRRQRQ